MKSNKLIFSILMCLVCSTTNGIELGDVQGINLNVSGYVKAETIWGTPEVGQKTVASTLRQSRFNIKADRKVAGRTVTGVYEADFWATSQETNPRLRHAYVSIDNFTIGETWSGQFFATAPFDVRMINFTGPGFGSIAGNGETVRPRLVAHYRNSGFIISAAKPIYRAASIPELVVSYQRRFKSGSGYSVAIAARETQNVVKNDSALGIAYSFQGKLAIANGALTAGVFSATGQGPNTGICANGRPVVPEFVPAPTSIKSAGCDFNTAGEIVSQVGYNVGFTQNLTKNLNFSTRYGEVVVNNRERSSSYMTTVTLVYQYLANLDFGAEWRYQSMANHPLRPIGRQAEIMIMYRF